MEYQKVKMVRLKDGTIVPAMLLKLNKYCGKAEAWKRLDDVPRKQRYIKSEDVEEVKTCSH